MNQDFNVSTEGVLILVGQSGLKNYYQDKPFDYDYPEGILPLLNQGIALVITTESGDEICLKVTLVAPPNISDFQDLGTYQMEVHPQDTLYLLDHATFTQICDGHQGDINQYEFDDTYNPRVTLQDIPPGWYRVQAYGKALDDFEEKECYLEMVFVFTSIDQPATTVLHDVMAI